MARDCSVDVRRAVVQTLHDDADVAAVVGDEVYGPAAKTEPQWPFIRCDAPPCFVDYDGCSADPSRYAFNVHGFAEGDDETNAWALGNLIGSKIDELDIQIATGPDAWLRDMHWTGTQVIGDTERRNGWHAIVSFEALVSADAL
jgi:hypothetical protein